MVIIFGFVGFKEYTLKSGEEVLLKTLPVDPRDLLRGDYVVLSYEIGRLDLKSVGKDADEFRENDRVYVVLDIAEGYGTAAGIYKQKPVDRLFIKGSVERARADTVWLSYGIENYFVPEGQGRKIERLDAGRVSVKASVDNFGNAVIKAVLIDGEEVKFD